MIAQSSLTQKKNSHPHKLSLNREGKFRFDQFYDIFGKLKKKKLNCKFCFLWEGGCRCGLSFILIYFNWGKWLNVLLRDYFMMIG